jgi:tRNA splicing ligase
MFDLVFALFANSLLHAWDVFPLGVLDPFLDVAPIPAIKFPTLPHDRILHALERVLQSQLRRGTRHVLIKWTDMPEAEATREPVDAFKAAHTTFHLEDERDVMTGRVYERTKRTCG